MYNLSDNKKAKLKALCRKMNIEAVTVERSEFGYKIGYLLGISDDDSRGDGADFDDEMLYIAGLFGGMLSLFIDQLRRNKIIIPLKAAQTETNAGFTSYELYRELSAERDAIARNISAHGKNS